MTFKNTLTPVSEKPTILNPIINRLDNEELPKMRNTPDQADAAKRIATGVEDATKEIEKFLEALGKALDKQLSMHREKAVELARAAIKASANGQLSPKWSQDSLLEKTAAKLNEKAEKYNNLNNDQRIEKTTKLLQKSGILVTDQPTSEAPKVGGSNRP